MKENLYSIVYENGTSQIKRLVKHDDYQLYNDACSLLIDKRFEPIVALIKAKQKSLFENTFTDQSPLYDAIRTGKLQLPEAQGGLQDITITKLQ